MIETTDIFTAQTTAATSGVFKSPRLDKGLPHPDLGSVIFHSNITGTGAVTATVEIYGNTVESTTGGKLLQTHTLNGTDADSAGDGVVYPWPYFYAKLTAISGTGATVNLNMAG